MTGSDDETLGAEFRLFARHIVRAEATPYQESKYLAAHRRFALEPRDGFERWLLRVARAGPAGVWLSDAYSGFLARKSVVRSKLVLTLALLECAPPSFADLDKPEGGRLAVFATALRGAEAALGLLLGAVILAPAQLWFATLGTRR